MIETEIGKLPKSVVDRIPLLMYIPPPPNFHLKFPISLGLPTHIRLKQFVAQEEHNVNGLTSSTACTL